MAGLWRTLTFSLVFTLFHTFAASQSFENAAVVRTAELGGALVHFMTTYAVKALEKNAKTYTLAFTHGELKRTSWLEVKLKETGEILDVTNNGLDESCNCYLFDVALPKPPAVGSTITILVETIQTHATEPWPETAAQSDPQTLRFKTDLFVISPYTTQVFRSKFRTSSPNYLSYTKPEGLQKFTSDAPVTKSGATLTYGPYNGLPITANLGFIGAYQQQLNLHYTYDYPVFEIRKLLRAAEISHWGANLNIQDEIHLHNGGPKLKGHFSRIDYATQSFRGASPAHVIPGFALHLPPGAKNVYYYDQIGNVSTSNFRPASGSTKHSLLALKPRYPLMGGWNYTFTLGWDAPLSDSVKYDKKSGKYIAEIPILTDIPTSVVNEAELKIVLPEGATDVHFQAPFPARSTEVVKHITYLDTVGRPALVFQYNDLTSRHVQSIYVSYRVPLSAHLKKPLAVATVFLSLFAFAFAVRRVDLSIQRKKKL